MELVEVEALASPRFSKCFECHVEAYGVPEPETVRDCAGDTINAHGLAFDAMLGAAKIEQRR
jgi:hypothetical protein